MPIFSSIEPHDTALRAPSEPSAWPKNFRHHEQREAPDAGRRALGARQHQVHDVLGEIVLAGEMKILVPLIR